MNFTFFIALLFGLQAFYWFIEKKASVNVRTTEDYLLAGKKTSFFPLMMTFFGAQVGGGLVLGAAEEAYKFGWIVILYPLGAACGLMLLGTRIGKRLAQFPISTVAQIFEVVYGSVLLKKVASILSIITLFISYKLNIPAGSSFLMDSIEKFTNPILSACFACSIVAAIISTSTSLINAISTNISCDFHDSFFQEKGGLLFAQGISVLISILAIVFAFFFNNVVDLLIQSFELSISSLIVPVLFGLFKKQGDPLAALLSMLLGAIGFCLFRIYPIEFPKEVASLSLSLLGYLIGYKMAKHSVILEKT